MVVSLLLPSCLLVVLCQGAAVKVHCNKAKVAKIQANTSHAVQHLYCEFKSSIEIRFEKGIEPPATKPSLFKVEWFTYNHRKDKVKLGMNVTWSMSGIDFNTTNSRFLLIVKRSGNVLERHLEVRVLDSQHKLVQSKNYANESTMQFNLQWYNDYIVPGESYDWNIMSRPLYIVETDPQEGKYKVTIPECCENTTVANTTHCSKEDCDECGYYDDDECEGGSGTMRISTSEPSAGIPYYFISILIAFAIMILIAIFGVVFCLKRHYLRARFAPMKGDALMLISSFGEDEAFHEQANSLVTLLESSQKLKVCFNLRERNKSDLNPLRWIAEKMPKYDNFILVCTPNGKQQLDQYQHMKGNNNPITYDPFAVGADLIESDEFKLDGSRVKHVTLVYFNQDQQWCVPHCFSRIYLFRDLVVRSFCLQNCLEDFYKYVTNGESLPKNGYHFVMKSDRLSKSSESDYGESESRNSVASTETPFIPTTVC